VSQAYHRRDADPAMGRGQQEPVRAMPVQQFGGQRQYRRDACDRFSEYQDPLVPTPSAGIPQSWAAHRMGETGPSAAQEVDHCCNLRGAMSLVCTSGW
jgi:hypothetical protein